MNKKPLVTVICICFNHQEFVIETINSVLNQSYSNIEIIIVDDCSSDDSISVITTFLKDYPKITFIKNKKNYGITKSFNLAVEKANGLFLVDLACDDILLPNCIEIQTNTFLNSDLNLTGIVFGNSENIDKNGKYISDYFETNSEKKVLDKSLFQTNLNKLLKGGLVMNSVSAMINKSVFDKLNGYDETLIFEDLDFWIRVLEKYEIIFIDKIISQKRFLKNSLGSHIENKNNLSNAIDDSMNKIYSKVIRKHKKNKTILKSVLKRIHNSIEISIRNKKMKSFLGYSLQKLKVHYFVLFAK